MRLATICLCCIHAQRRPAEPPEARPHGLPNVGWEAARLALGRWGELHDNVLVALQERYTLPMSTILPSGAYPAKAAVVARQRQNLSFLQGLVCWIKSRKTVAYNSRSGRC